MSLRSRKLFASAIAPTAMALGIGALSSGAGSAAGAATEFHPGIAVKVAGGTSNSAVQSANWAGYDKGLLDTGALAQSVSAEWTVPTATQEVPGQAEASATWIGIGGGCVNMTSGCSVTDPTLIQAGTEQDVSSTGQATYSAWWEILPVPSVTASVIVEPGDRVSVSIAQTLPGVWTITFKDLSHPAQSFTQTVPYTSTMDSAEWIEEAPVVISTGNSPVSAGEAALPDLGTVNFDDASLNGKRAALSPGFEMEMVNSSGEVIAVPSSPDPAGNGFDVCTYTSTCTAPSS